MNTELVNKALRTVVNPNVLVNMVSQRVRQLNSGGTRSNPLVAEATKMSAADIALLEIIEYKVTFEMPEIIKLTRPTGKHGKRPQHWARVSSNGENVRSPIR